MRVLIIGGTGTISLSVVRELVRQGKQVSVLNRGKSNSLLPAEVETIRTDIHDEEGTKALLAGRTFDCVCQFTNFLPEDCERDIRLFAGRTSQYIYISSASAYHKPLHTPWITESTPLHNPYWAYSRNKAASEALLFAAYREQGFPVTVVRPSHTYDERKIPVAIHGDKGSMQVVRRILEGKPVLLPGDGTSLWTLTYASDFAVGFAGLVGNRKALGEAVHITGDDVRSWNEYHEILASALGRKLIPYHVSSDFLAKAGEKMGYDLEGGLLGDKAESVLFDNSKLKRLVPEMCTRVWFEEGAERFARRLKDHPEMLEETDPVFDAWCDRVIAAQEEALLHV